MKRYRIKKMGMNHTNSLSPISTFGDKQDYFEGYSSTPPTPGKRFNLRNRLGESIINTSIVVSEVKDGMFMTVYSKYSIEEL